MRENSYFQILKLIFERLAVRLLFVFVVTF